MLNKTTLALAATALAFCASTGMARADGCSGRDHTGGTIIGAIAGGVIGGAVSHGNGGAVVGGAIVGGLAGNAIARDMDCDDQSYASRSYYDAFDGPVGRRYEWSHGRNHGWIVVSREYREGRRWCRDFHTVTWRHGDRRERDGTACRRHGRWEIV
jgi:surface antigen